MADDTDLADDDRKPHRSGRVRRIALVGAGTVALVLGGVWGARERIAANLIDRELASLQLPMQYRIVSIGLGREVLGSVVVGDPVHPDLTVDRVDVVLRYGLGGPQIDRLALIKPRLHGRVIDGQVHLGALDRVLYARRRVNRCACPNGRWCCRMRAGGSTAILARWPFRPMARGGCRTGSPARWVW